VTGKNSFVASGAEKEINKLLGNKDLSFFNSFSSNPDINEVKNGIDEIKKTEYDLIIAIGGGSTIDIAKAINALANNIEKPEKYITGETKLTNPGLPLIAIPLTSGTGSESTHFSTIYINKTKHSLSHKEYILPDYAIVDPELTESIPKKITASTGMDALCQAIESYWSVNSTEESLIYAKDSIKLAINNLENAVNNPKKDSREKMALAAHLSGKAINISKTTAPHSISYPITSFFDIPHGHAVSLTIGQILEYNYHVSKKDCNDNRGSEFVKNRIDEIISLLGCKNIVKAKERIKILMKNIELENKLSFLGIDERGVEKIVEKGFTPERMNNNPRKIHKENLREILDEIS